MTRLPLSSLILVLAGCTSPIDNGEAVALTDVSFFQAVEIPVLLDGAAQPALERTAPIVAGRPGVLAARIDVSDDWNSAEVELVVAMGGETHRMSAQVSEASDSTDASTWLVVDLPASAFVADASFAVSLEVDGVVVDAFPTDGEEELGAVTTGPLKVHVVPFEVEGSVPDTSPDVLNGMRDALMAMYPVTDVAVTAGAVEVWDQPFDLGDLNVRLGVIQETAMFASLEDWDVYYYGMTDGGVATREDFPDGPTGTSENGGQNPTRAFFASGAAFGDERSESTMVHELGHLHQLLHIPCTGSEDNVDEAYPHAEGSIGTWGWDLRSEEFLSPSASFDVMGYCTPRWISDYSYALAADHVAYAQTFNDRSR